MATNQTGIAIVIKAWLPVTGPISEQIAKLQMVEAAHTSGDYAELLKASTVEDIKTEQKTRRIEEASAPLSSPELSGNSSTSSQDTGSNGERVGEHGSTDGETQELLKPEASSDQASHSESSETNSETAPDWVEAAFPEDVAEKTPRSRKRA